MTSVNTIFFVFICIFAVIGALVFLLIFIAICALIISAIFENEEEINECPYEVEGEKQND